MIVVLHRFGMANRLRSLASFVRLSTVLRRRLHVSWKYTNSCGCHWGDLFDTSSEDVFDIIPPREEYIALLDRTIGEPYDERSTVTRQLRGLVQYPRELNESMSGDIIVLHHNGWFALHGDSCLSAFAFKRHFYQSLRSSKPVSHLVDQVWQSKLEGHVVVGVHIRRSDSIHDWASVAFGGDNYASFDEVVPNLEKVKGMMRAIWSRRPEVIFYIASNDVQTKAELYHPSKCVMLDIRGEEQLSRSSASAMQIALAEFLLLARTELVVHTFGSSFGQEAAFYGRVEELLVRDGADIYQSNEVAGAFCGHTTMRGVRTNIDNLITHEVGFAGAGSEIKENGVDYFTSRFVPCPTFQSKWGIQNVFC